MDRMIILFSLVSLSLRWEEKENKVIQKNNGSVQNIFTTLWIAASEMEAC